MKTTTDYVTLDKYNVTPRASTKNYTNSYSKTQETLKLNSCKKQIQVAYKRQEKENRDETEQRENKMTFSHTHEHNRRAYTTSSTDSILTSEISFESRDIAPQGAGY